MKTQRRYLLKSGATLSAGALSSVPFRALAAPRALLPTPASPATPIPVPPAPGRTADLASRRAQPSDCTFTSPAVEAQIRQITTRIDDPELAWMFTNCYPNTLDTTVWMSTLEGKEDVFVITGDIPCLWLRDSSGQVWLYPRNIPSISPSIGVCAD